MADGTEKRKGDSGSPTRWWEQYTVRYFVGTVVGAVILVVLGRYARLASAIAVLFPVGPTGEIGGWGITAVAGAGLAYCYIASAPVLTLHAIRGGLGLLKPRGGLLLVGFLVALVVLPALAWSIALKAGSGRAFGWMLTGEMVALQLGLIVYAQRDGFAKINGFYDQLVRARLSDKTQGADYRDSYRHMREHGNAKSILVFEILLGIIVATAQTPAELIAMLVLWLAPAAYVWFIASVLEAHFSNVQGGITAANQGAAPRPRI